jgi:hypothetical protein
MTAGLTLAHPTTEVERRCDDPAGVAATESPQVRLHSICWRVGDDQPRELKAAHCHLIGIAGKDLGSSYFEVVA